MEDINIKVNVDSSNGVKGTQSIKAQLRELREQMVELEVSTNGLSTATEEQRAKYAELEKQASSIKDAIGDVNQRINQGADDFAKFSAVMEGMGAATAVVQGLTGQLELLGVTNAGAEKLTKTFIALQGQLNAINQVQQVFNKDSKLMQQIQGTLNKAIDAGGTSLKVATVAQKGLNTAMKAAPYIAIASAIISIVSALVDFIKTTRQASDEQKDLGDSVEDTTKKINEQKNTISANWDATKKAAQSLYELAKSEKDVGVQAEYLKQFSQVTGLNVRNINELNSAWALFTGTVSEYKEVAEKNKAAIDDQNSRLAQTRTQLQAAREEWENLTLSDKEYWPVHDKKVQLEKNEETILKNITNLYDGYNRQTAVANATIAKWNANHEKSTKTTKKATDEIKTETKETKKLNDEKERQLKIERDLVAETLQRQEWANEDAKQAAEGEVYLWEQRMLVMDEYSSEYYEAMREKLRISLEGGLMTQYEYDAAIRDLEASRTEFIASEEERRQNLREKATQETFAGIHSIMDSAMSAELDMAEGNEKKQKQIRQKYAIANLVVNAAESAAALAVSIPKTLAAYSEIPFAGPVLAAIQIAATTAAIVAQIANINKQKGEIMKAARGAFIVGPSHSQGGVTMEVEGGEAVLNKRAMAIPEYRALASYMNTSTGGVAFPGGSTSTGAPIAATIDRNTIREIVNEVASIPVVVSESSITSTQRRVSSIEGRSRL